ncbi:MAG: RagB/SusD family nutrient uptake outer membrane protein [Proteiniphilum sp.]|uniref:RagB/SusD family nutrient uptake outer membrane protein n=1 Tax=Proteiniphilum sp. TaxID=1926877 RepID=UPI000926D685|nr:RagB/SusD family nutrient uptake outer membrane protein [Proteiniphilum sp.]MEA5128867.1 RagB/SusD family nutrient uptake outer membrane protein [Proteiniphilum sp.]OJV88595.1 MAG: RagB/SusD family nutrient uptake outer membrane protein [Bacteroidia bacterium 44-10]
MKSYKNLLLLIIAILFLSGCEGYLSKDPIGLLTPDQVDMEPAATTVRYAVSSSYQLLSGTLNIIGDWAWNDGTVTRGDFILQDIASDDMQKKWNPDGDQAWMDEFDNFSFIASNGGFNGIWTYNYEGISRVNTAIDYLTDEEMMTKLNFDRNEQNRLLGEVYFLRAFYYFDLVTNFGGVPLLLKPLTSFNEAYEVAVRTTAEEIWTQIDEDLSNAKNLLPDAKYSNQQEKWRVSKGAVMALQAKVALFNERWQEVITLVNELESANYYSLNDNYFDSFDVNKQFQEQEVIFCYNHEPLQTPRKGNGLCALLGWGFVAPETSFIEAFEENDPRLLYTVDVDSRNVNKILGTLNGEFKGDDDAPGNKIYIRYADVLLWKSEALLQTGDLKGAIEIINQIRQRSRNTITVDGTTSPTETLPDRNVDESNKTVVTGWLMHERRVELGFESHRFRDLKRWRIAEEILASRGFQKINYLYPIPQGEIDKSGGSIVQNEGY